MKIAVDGGALCAGVYNRYGNYVFTENLIKSCANYDKKNQYIVYHFCQDKIKPSRKSNIKYKCLLPKINWINLAVGKQEFIASSDFFLALNQAIPPLLKAKVISFSHGLSFIYYPQYYPDSYNKMKKQIDDMARRSEYIIVSSQKVKNEWLTLYPKLDNIIVIAFGIPFDMLLPHSTFQVEENKAGKYFLYVGMDHPVKNIAFIVSAFKKAFKNKKDIYLYLVGVNDSWQKFDQRIKTFRYIDRKQLKTFYYNAAALLTASYYESFNLPVLEALALNCPVIGLRSAIIPELEKYVKIANNKKDFCGIISNYRDLNRNNKLNKRFRDQFNWEKYVSQLPSRRSTAGKY